MGIKKAIDLVKAYMNEYGEFTRMNYLEMKCILEALSEDEEKEPQDSSNSVGATPCNQRCQYCGTWHPSPPYKHLCKEQPPADELSALIADVIVAIKEVREVHEVRGKALQYRLDQIRSRIGE